jgi:hypothetical protein
MHEILGRFKPDLIILSETHTQFENSKRFWEKEGHTTVNIIEAVGHSGGLWVLGNINCLYSFTVFESIYQCTTVEVTRGNSSWFCSGIYASPIISIRETLWDYLRDLRNCVNQP